MASTPMRFAKTQTVENADIDKIQDEAWHVLVVDDEKTVHEVTALVLAGFRFENKPVKLWHVYTGSEARLLLKTGHKFAAMLLDVVMESEHAGLELVDFVRNILGDSCLRILLHTGQPGYAPELKVVLDYDINDYSNKSELTADKLKSSLVTALRSYRDLTTIQKLGNDREILHIETLSKNQELAKVNEQLLLEIKERADAEAKLENTNLKLESIVNNSSSLISLKHLDGSYDFVNKVFLDSLALPNTMIIGARDEELFPAENASLIKYNDEEILHKKQAIQCEELYPTHDGEHFYLCVKFPLYGNDGEMNRICTIATDITDRLEAQNQILHNAQYDILTDLPNRGLFVDRINQASARQEWNQIILGVLFIDLDRFKLINDTMGHDVGDKLLQAVAKRLKSVVRDGDTVSRLGGDEFAILLTELASESDVVKVIDKIMVALSEKYLVNGKELIVTPSIGVSLCPIDGTDTNVLLKKADIAMYKAKENGRNGFSFYSIEDDAHVERQLALEMALRCMIGHKAKELCLHYQPKVDISSGKITGVEALLRWNHPEQGFISPGIFIPILEDTGLIEDVGEWVLQQACHFAKHCNHNGFDIRVAINLSSRQFNQVGLLELLQQTLASTDCRPDWIELEVTEGTLAHDFEQAKDLLQQISAMGISLAIDDFGTGYSSLKYLKELPFNTLKIDRSFIVDATTLEQDKAIVTTIAQLAHNLNMSVVAEGVETPEQFHLIRALTKGLQAAQIQGFLFSKPVPGSQLPSMPGQINTVWNQLQ